MDEKAMTVRKPSLKEKIFGAFFKEQFEELQAGREALAKYQEAREHISVGTEKMPNLNETENEKNSRILEQQKNREVYANLIKQAEEKMKALKELEDRLNQREQQLDAREKRLNEREQILQKAKQGIEKTTSDIGYVEPQDEQKKVTTYLDTVEGVTKKALGNLIEDVKKDPIMTSDELTDEIKKDSNLSFLQYKPDKNSELYMMKLCGIAKAYGDVTMVGTTQFEELGGSTLDLWIKQTVNSLVRKPTKEQIASRMGYAHKDIGTDKFYYGPGLAKENGQEISDHEHESDYNAVNLESKEVQVTILRSIQNLGEKGLRQLYGNDYDKVMAFIEGYREVTDNFRNIPENESRNYNDMTIAANTASYFLGDSIGFLEDGVKTVDNASGENYHTIEGTEKSNLSEIESSRSTKMQGLYYDQYRSGDRADSSKKEYLRDSTFVKAFSRMAKSITSVRDKTKENLGQNIDDQEIDSSSFGEER